MGVIIAFSTRRRVGWTRRQVEKTLCWNMLLYFNVKFDASRSCVDASPRFHHASKMYKTRHRNMLLYFNVILDASCTFSTRPQRHWIIVAYFHDASKMYRTRHRNMLLYFNAILDASCKFSTRRNLHSWPLRQNN